MIRLLFLLKETPSDFVDALIDALKEGLTAGEQDSQLQVAGFIEAARHSEGEGRYFQMLRELATLCLIIENEEKVAAKHRLVSSIYALCSTDTTGAFGGRILLGKIEALIQELKD